MKTGSIRFRLTLWCAAVLAVAAAALSALLFVHLKDYLENELLRTQARRARQIAESLIPQIGSAGAPDLAQQIEVLYVPEKSDRFIRITAINGAILYVSGSPNDQMFDPLDIPVAKPSPRGEFTRKEAVPQGAALLIAGSRAMDRKGNEYLVEVGVSAASVEALFNHVLLLLALGLPVIVIFAAGGAYVLVGRALRPVDRIAGKAEQITQHNLSERLPAPRTGDELERLSVALNHMITRLEDAFLNSKRFVSDASHELRTPLTILRGELEAFAQETGLSQEHRDRLGSLLEEVERLSKIVDRLFALSRLDAGEAQAEWVSFDFAAMAATTTEQMTLLAEDRSIALTCETLAPVFVKGDRARLKQVLVNLIDNAIHYTSAGGSVRVTVSVAGAQAVLEVVDTGVGIPPDALPLIFERFFRVDKTRSSHPEGAGLGLAIVKSICHAHGGTIAAESTPGHGSRFHVRLPLSDEPNP